MPHDTTEQHEILRTIDLFEKIDEESIDALCQSARLLSFRKNAVLMSEGESGEAFYIVKSGAVRIFVSDEEGNEIILNDLGAGDYFGEVSLLDGEPRTASAMAVQRTQVLAVPKHAFVACVQRNPHIAFVIIRTMTMRLRRATAAIRSLALENVYKRLAGKLADLAALEDGHTVLPRKYSNQELATMIGASREMVGRILNDLVAGGYMEKRGNRWQLNRDLPENW
ncbi:MAG: Crp/Fnr family transcriptional regulator [Granulosicoccus sp.]